MKHLFTICLLAVTAVMVACSPKLTDGNGADSNKKMAVYYGTIQYTESYCGGARPPEELLKQYATPKPFASDTLRFKNVQTGAEFLVATDEHGHYEAILPAGNYVIHPALRPTSQGGYSPNYDPNCKQWKELELYRLDDVQESEEKMVDFTVHIPCDPCETIRRP